MAHVACEKVMFMDERLRLDEETIALGRRRIAEIRAMLRKPARGPEPDASTGSRDERSGAETVGDDDGELIVDPAERVALMRRIHELELENRLLRLGYGEQPDEQSDVGPDVRDVVEESRDGGPVWPGQVIDTPPL